MVTKRIRSEYMKKFKDPKWETYTKCYEEMLAYRLTRRLLEHTHNPWFWSGSDSDSDSAGRSPLPPSKNQVVAGTGGDGAEGELEGRTDAQQDQQNRTTEPVPRLHIPDEEEDASALHSAVHEKDTGGPQPQKTKPSKSTKQTWRSQRVRPAPLQPPRDELKESRHPFALYGSGEKDADIASRKTHNVGPAASTTEIHESALRAKTRREVERQIQSQRSERRRAKSADLGKARKLVPADFNPWLTEYMRCFSARTR
ncbi:centriole, cilia and spindle-associated protein isoform X2 [Kryptolebias marmoratus]|uniref:Centriole, cilia and spindle-associated protein b n=1 Tax=Kryptolebias marmoratus TaxID=37003 RepID=A0A3Q3BCQ9_KRYMA|nr:centriole, cilia and spindle-associated protein isoform X2 [Kryptolebias marmoratus]